MTTLSGFNAVTPRNALPFLFAGQSQREFYVNEALARIDMLLHPCVEGELAEPPTAPADGACYLVASSATGDWAGREGHIAGWIAGAWTFAAPYEGIRVRDRTTASVLSYDGQWRRHTAPTLPSGGSVIDDEARSAIGEVVAILRQHGLFD